SSTGPAITSFTQADLNSGSVFFVTDDPNYVGGAAFTVSLSDGGSAGLPSVAFGISIVDAQTSIQTTAGYNFNQDDPITALGAGQIQNGYSATAFTVTNVAANRDFIIKGVGLTFAGSGTDLHLTGGTITSIVEQTHDTSASLATFTLYVA